MSSSTISFRTNLKAPSPAPLFAGISLAENYKNPLILNANVGIVLRRAHALLTDAKKELTTDTNAAQQSATLNLDDLSPEENSALPGNLQFKYILYANNLSGRKTEVNYGQVKLPVDHVRFLLDASLQPVYAQRGGGIDPQDPNRWAYTPLDLTSTEVKEAHAGGIALLANPNETIVIDRSSETPKKSIYY